MSSVYERRRELVDDIGELAARIDAAQRDLLAYVRQIDEEYVWGHYGLRTCAAFLSWRIGVGTSEGTELVRVAKALGGLPLIDEALGAGQISYSKVRMVTRVADASNEKSLVTIARNATASQLRRICKQVERLTTARSDEEAPARWVRVTKTREGMARLCAQLLPDEAALVMKAVEAGREPESTEPEVPTDSPVPRPNRADGLVKVAEGFLAGERTTSTGGERCQIVLHLKPDVLDGQTLSAELEDGTVVAADTFRRVACDCGLVPVSVDGQGRPLDVGRKTRSIPPALRRALRVRDPVCCFPGCSNDRYVDVHHIQHWAHGGATSLDNTVVLCCAHHHLVHEGGFSVARDSAGELVFRNPEGQRLDELPTLIEVERGHPYYPGFEKTHLLIGSDANFVYWDGSRQDLNWAIGVAMPRSASSRSP